MLSSVRKKKRWFDSENNNVRSSSFTTWHSIERTNKQRQITLILTLCSPLFVFTKKPPPQRHNTDNRRNSHGIMLLQWAVLLHLFWSVSDSRLLTNIVYCYANFTYHLFNFILIILHFALLVINLSFSLQVLMTTDVQAVNGDAA
jgi:hypothetical protein